MPGAVWKGLVTGIYASTDPLQQGFGGAVLVNDFWFWVPTPFAAAMLVVAADAKRAGTPVWIRATDQAVLIDINSSPVQIF
jgi:hypothetical protein